MRNTLLALSIALPLFGCSGKSPTPTVDMAAEPADAAMPDTPMDAATPVDLAGPPCKAAGAPDGGVYLATVSGTIVDESNMGLGALQVTVCGAICFYGVVGGTGDFLVKLDECVATDRWATEVHGRPDRASYYIPLPPINTPSVTYPSPFIVPLLPVSGPTIKLDKSAQMLMSGDVTMTLAAGTTVSLDVEDIALNALGQELRVVTITDPKKMSFIDVSDPPLAMYGFAPFESQYTPGAQFSFKNSFGLAANAAVDVYAEVGLYDPQAAGTFTKVATAHVTGDASMIAMDEGQLFTMQLRWLLLRKGT